MAVHAARTQVVEHRLFRFTSDKIEIETSQYGNGETVVIEGQILGPGGNRLDEQIWVHLVAGRGRLASIKTNMIGEFQFPHVPRGPIVLEFELGNPSLSFAMAM